MLSASAETESSKTRPTGDRVAPYRVTQEFIGSFLNYRLMSRKLRRRARLRWAAGLLESNHPV
jgi:hypothetical protein